MHLFKFFLALNFCFQIIWTAIETNCRPLDDEVASNGEDIFNIFSKYFFVVYKTNIPMEIPPHEYEHSLSSHCNISLDEVTISLFLILLVLIEFLVFS